MDRSILDLVADCDNLPYPDEGPAYQSLVSTYYTFTLLSTWSAICDTTVRVGYLLPSTVQHMPWLPQFTIDHSARTVSIPFSPDASESDILREQLNLARSNKTFAVLSGWRDELYPVLDLGRDVRMERSGSALFGIHTAGVHMIAYTYSPRGSSTGSNLKTWVARRSATKQTYPGMLDNTVAGGIAAGEDPFESVVREADEEASLPEDYVRQRIKSCGSVSYFHVRDERAGGESGLLQPETQYLYEMEIYAQEADPKPHDSEVEGFVCWSTDESKAALRRGEFKPNCAMVLIEFLIRHGEITQQEEKHYREIIERMHRRIRF